MYVINIVASRSIRRELPSPLFLSTRSFVHDVGGGRHSVHKKRKILVASQSCIVISFNHDSLELGKPVWTFQNSEKRRSKYLETFSDVLCASPSPGSRHIIVSLRLKTTTEFSL